MHKLSTCASARFSGFLRAQRSLLSLLTSDAMHATHLPNPYICEPATAPAFDSALTDERVTALLPALEKCCRLGDVPTSWDRPARDPTVYTGLCGVALAFLALILPALRVLSKRCICIYRP